MTGETILGSCVAGWSVVCLSLLTLIRMFIYSKPPGRRMVACSCRVMSYSVFCIRLPRISTPYRQWLSSWWLSVCPWVAWQDLFWVLSHSGLLLCLQRCSRLFWLTVSGSSMFLHSYKWPSLTASGRSILVFYC